jgi:UDP-glucose 4-epimerase
MKKVLLLGGNGFIGKHLQRFFLNIGYEIAVLDQAGQPILHKSIHFFSGKASDPQLINQALNEVDLVVHLQSSILPSDGIHDHQSMVPEHIASLSMLLDAMERVQIPRIIYFSSGGAVYGNPDIIPTPESQACQPINVYGLSKQKSEELLMGSISKGFNPLILRPSNAYGLHQGHIHKNGLISTLFHAAKQGESVQVFGDGSEQRDYIYVNDIVNFIAVSLEKEAQGIYNVGTERGRSVEQIINLALQITGKDIPFHYLPSRPENVKNIVLDCSKARINLGWSASFSVERGMENLWNSWS